MIHSYDLYRYKPTWGTFEWDWDFNKQSHLWFWGRDKMAAIFQTTFSNAFSWMKTYKFRLRFHWSLFPRVQLNIFPTLIQIMAWRRPGDKPLSEPMMVILLTHICVTRPQWVKPLLIYAPTSTAAKVRTECLYALKSDSFQNCNINLFNVFF